MEKIKIHYKDPNWEPVMWFNHTLCWGILYSSRNKEGIVDVNVTTDLNKVTCPKCVYYYFHPDALALERAYRDKNRG